MMRLLFIFMIMCSSVFAQQTTNTPALLVSSDGVDFLRARKIIFDSTTTTDNGNGTITVEPSSSSGISGLTPGFVPYASTPSSIVDSIIYSGNGNVGIGTIFPTAQFEIDSNNTVPMKITKTVSGDYLTITSTGNVGLGTINPSYLVDVYGTAYESGVRSTGGYDIKPVVQPSSITGVVSAGGSVDTGTHYYFVTYYTAAGETNVRLSSVITTTAGNNTVTLTIPVSTDPRVIGRKLYRTKAGGSSALDYNLTTIANNTATSYVDTTADSALTGTAPVAFYRTNSTTAYITINGLKSFTPDTNATYVGLEAGGSNINGGFNTFIGKRAGFANTSASFNTFVGQQASQATNTGSLNTCLGYLCMGMNTQGANNTAVGVDALYSNATGSYNTIVGNFALFGSTNVSNNTAVGYNAARYLADGSTSLDPGNSLYLGYDTRGLTAGETNAIVIGYLGRGLGTNSTVIGNTLTTKTVLYGNVGIGTISPDAKLEVAGQIEAGAGSVTNPAFGFLADHDNGMYYTGTNAIGLVTGGSSRINIDSSGNVGIGTSVPISSLQIDTTTTGVNVNYITSGGGLDSFAKLGANWNGADAATSYTAETGQSATFADNAQLDTAQKWGGTASVLFDGTGDYVTFPDNDNWYFDGNFVIEFMIRFNAFPAASGRATAIAQQADASNVWAVRLFNNGGTYQWDCVIITGGSTIVNQIVTTTISTGTWYHIAWVRSGTNWYVFQNGTQVGSTTSSAGAFSNLAASLQFGLRGTTTQPMNGWIDAVRISKGTDRGWTSAFTAPSIEYGSAAGYPYSKLSVNGTQTAKIWTDGASTPSDSLKIDVASTTRATIDSSGNVGIATTSPKAKLQVDGTVYLGGPVNATTIESDGTIYFSGTSTVWDDLVMPASALSLGATAADVCVVNGTLRALCFDNIVDQSVDGGTQWSHSMKPNSTVSPHIHWGPSGTGGGNVLWSLAWSCSNINGTQNLGTGTVLANAGTTAHKHMITELPDIDTSLYGGLSAVCLWNLSRTASSATDTYGADAELYSFDIHYEIDTIGSRTKLSK